VLRYFLRLGTSGFGGPIAVVGYMQRDLVEQRGWIAREDFLNGVALGQAMPGPLAAQVAMWAGYLRRGALGAAAAAAAFIIPSFLMVTAVAVLYVHYAGLRVVQSLFYGIAPAVMAIIAMAAWAISAVVFTVTAITGQEPIYLIIGAGLLMIAVDARPALRRPRPKPPAGTSPPVPGAVPLYWAAMGAAAGAGCWSRSGCSSSRPARWCSGPGWRSCRCCATGSSPSTTGSPRASSSTPSRWA
jgi:chromate transporter